MSVHRRFIWFVFEKIVIISVDGPAVIRKFLESLAAENCPAASDPQLFDVVSGRVLCTFCIEHSMRVRRPSGRHQMRYCRVDYLAITGSISDWAGFLPPQLAKLLPN